MKGLLVTDDSHDMGKSDKRHPEPTNFARVDFAQIMGRAERKDDEDVYIGKQYIARDSEDRLFVISLSK